MASAVKAMKAVVPTRCMDPSVALQRTPFAALPLSLWPRTAVRIGTFAVLVEGWFEKAFFQLFLTDFDCCCRYGCCDPGNLRYAEDNYAYSLFSKANLGGGEPMSVLKIDLNTGAKTGDVLLVSPLFLFFINIFGSQKF